MTDTPIVRTPTGIRVDGDAVRERRKRLGYTIVGFAPKVQISIGYLSQIERGTRQSVSPPTFSRLASALGLADRPERIEARQQRRRSRKAA